MKGQAAETRTTRNLYQIGPQVVRLARRALAPEKLAWSLVALGVFLRLAPYAANHSLWFDEAALALNIINRSPEGLLRPLDYGQGAPVGFLILEKVAVQAMGNDEYALRLVPLLSGIVSLLLLYQVARQSIRPRGVPIALGLFAISSPLIRFSAELKQYSSDVAIALLVVAYAQVLRNGSGLSVPRMLALAIGGAVLLWFSHPALFMLMSAGILAFMVFYHNGDRVAVSRFSIVVAIWMLSLALFYYVSLRHLRADEYLTNYWAAAFLPLPPSRASVEWLGGTLLQLFTYPVGLSFPSVGALTCLVGAATLWVEKRVTFLTLVLPMCFALAASGIRSYPFEGRLILFLVPVFVLLIAEGTARLIATTKPYMPVTGMLLIGLLCFHPVLYAATHLVTPPTIEEIKPVMAYVKTHQQQGDVVYVYYASRSAFNYYAGRYGFAAGSYVPGISSRHNQEKYLVDLDRLRGKRRVWLLFSHFYGDERDLFLHYLDAGGTRLDSFEREGAWAYLYDLSRKDL